MAETNQIVFTHQEVVECLIKKHGIHEGIWGLYVRFGLKATNVGVIADPGVPADGDVYPAAIIPLLQLGVQRFPEMNNLTVDAAVVNPAPVGSAKARRGNKSSSR
jgi:hypothetical protein